MFIKLIYIVFYNFLIVNNLCTLFRCHAIALAMSPECRADTPADLTGLFSLASLGATFQNQGK